MNTTKRNRDESGFTFVELTVGMVIFGIISMLMFQVFDTTIKSEAQGRQLATENSASIAAQTVLNKAIRNSSVTHVPDDGKSLWLQNADGSLEHWFESKDGLTNGSLTIKGAHNVAFQRWFGGKIIYSFTAGRNEVSLRATPRLQHDRNDFYDALCEIDVVDCSNRNPQDPDTDPVLPPEDGTPLGVTG